MLGSIRGVLRVWWRDLLTDTRPAADAWEDGWQEALRSACAVLAASDGIVDKFFESRAGGLTVYQRDPSGQYQLYYAHLESYAPGLQEGDVVRQGQLIGFVGTSGNAPKDVPHLHFAIFRMGPHRRWWEGEAVNPYPLLARK